MLDKKTLKNTCFFDPVFYKLLGHFWSIFRCFLKPSGGQKSLWRRSRCDLVKNEKTSKSVIGSLRNQGSQVQKLMKKWAWEACWDLKKTPAAPMNEKVRFFIDFGSILGPFWEPKSMQNRIKKWVENRYPKKSTKRGLKGAPATSDTYTAGLQGPWEGGGDVNIPTSKNQHQIYSRSNTPLGQRPGEFNIILN